MNRFRTKRRAKEDPGPGGRSSSEEQHSLPSFKGFRRGGKKAPEEEEKVQQIDLTSALPPSDDFRTSLLMTGLSARFSMLREQDDPNTKIGKASDDSVLFPQRQSRLMTDFNFKDLDDIAEVESIKAAPPFTRKDSYASDTDSQQGSMMGRTRPGEGNNLFGGRQKIYRIAGGGHAGRVVYEDDVAMSTFQKFKQKEKERLAMLDLDDTSSTPETTRSFPSTDNYDSASSPFTRSDSPSPLGYNLRRETSSTSSSGARNSTAATSVVSQPTSSVKDFSTQSQITTPSTTHSNGSIERTTTRARRLYEQGLNQDLQEHQTSALSRVDTLTGRRMLGSRTPDFSSSSSSPTGFSFNDRLGLAPDRRQILSKGSAPNLRSVSPPTMNPSNATGIAKPTSNLAETSTVTIDPRPMSPALSEADEHPVLAIEPRDVGKATSMGVFQKPTQPYDESRFAQRQMQLQQGRETPTERFRAESNASQATGISSRSSSVPRHTPRSSEQKTTGVVAAAVAALAAGTAASTLTHDNGRREEAPKPKAFTLNNHEDDAVSSTQEATPLPPTAGRPSDQEHPAFRQSAMPTPLLLHSKSMDFRSPIIETPEVSEESTEPVTIDGLPVDSPTLPGAGLSGMVRQHLRNTSTASSVYSTITQAPNTSDNYQSSTNHGEPVTIQDLIASSSPWDDDELALPPVPSLAGKSPSSPSSQQNTPKTSLEAADDRTPDLSAIPRFQLSQDSERTSDELDKDDELDDFANQLANARRRVQERLNSYVESDSSRNTSPVLGPTEPSIPTSSIKSNPLGILRGKSSRGSLIDRHRDVSQSRAMKMLGIGSATMSTTASPSKPSFDDAVASGLTSSPSAPAIISTPAVPALNTMREEKEEEEQTFHTKSLDSQSEREPVSPPSSAPASVPRSSSDADDESTGLEQDRNDSTPSPPNEEDENLHPGLRAFRNARRQLQKQKDLESLAQHQTDAPAAITPVAPRGLSAPLSPPTGTQPAPHPTYSANVPPTRQGPPADFSQRQGPPPRERRGPPPAGGRERIPPPMMYKQRDFSQESRESAGTRSRSQSRASDRDRSVSDSSRNGAPRSGQIPPPPRMRNSPPRDDRQHGSPRIGANGMAGPNGMVPPPRHSPYGGPMQPAVRTPGQPGSDTRQSPRMAPQRYASSPALRSMASSSTLNVQTSGATPVSAQASPISPLAGSTLPSSPYMSDSGLSSTGEPPVTPAATKKTHVHTPPSPEELADAANRMQKPPPGFSSSTLTDAMKKFVRKEDISEPKFIMSTSRVPTVSLSTASTKAPLLPPVVAAAPTVPAINPMRKPTGTRRGIMGGIRGRRGTNEEADVQGTIGMPYVTDDEALSGPRRLRKQASDATGLHSRMMVAGPPPPRMDVPGGMI